ncbi:MAG: hypothetical protein IPI30_03575 [Saprospiraceae bacterium]|nr:hypothetical protein [Candidatus Vicinibacter affinis]
MGFVKSVYPSAVPQLTKEISKPLGWIWLLTTLILLLAAILFILNKPVWTAIALLGILLSQILIFTSWTDARFGTVANVIILICALPAYRYQSFLKNTEIEIQNFKETNSSLVNHQSISDLPPIVQKWLIRSGVTGNEAHLIFHALQKDK